MDRIFVVTHKSPEYTLENGYSWLKVGSGKFNAEFCDDVGDSIADKNRFYSELTALYWIWKNYSCHPTDLVGLVHYRRFFGVSGFWGVFRRKILSFENVKRHLSRADMIVPSLHPFRSGLFSHYERSHPAADLEACLTYLRMRGKLENGVEQQFRSARNGRICNMLITRKEVLDEYCSWLFPIIFAVEPSLNLGSREPYQQRAMGFLSERLFNLWLYTKPELQLVDCPIIRIDKSRWSNLNTARKNWFTSSYVGKRSSLE